MDHVVAFARWRGELKHLAEFGGPFGRLLDDAHGAVALHVAVAAHRAGPGPRLAEVAAHQQQVDEHLDGGDAVALLGEAHGPAGDHTLGRGVAVGDDAHLVLTDARLGDQVVPRGAAQVLGEGPKAVGVLGDEGVVEHGVGGGVFEIQEGLAYAFEEGQVAADRRLHEVPGDGGGLLGEHGCFVLGVNEGFEAALA